MKAKPQAPQRATKRRPPPTIDKLNKCAERGLTRLETAKACKCSYQKVCRLAIKHEIEFRDEVRGAKPKKKERLRVLLLPFMTNAIDSVNYEEIAKAIGCSKPYIYKQVKEMKAGLSTTSKASKAQGAERQ